MTAIKDRLAGPEDYSGGGTGQVLVEVQDGDAASDIAATLRDKDVVKSVEAFTDAARKDSRSVGIQVGFYEMKKQMSADAALEVLVDPANRMRSVVTVPEGLTVDQIVATLAKKTDFSRKQFDKVLAQPGRDRPAVVRQGQRGGLPLPGDVRAAAERHPPLDPDDDGRALEPGRRGRRPDRCRRSGWATRRPS